MKNMHMPSPLLQCGISFLPHSLSRHRPTPKLAVLCSSRPFIPPSFHPSIRPCPVIYNSSGILPPSNTLHQDSISILFGPQLRCTHVCVMNLRNDSQAQPVGLYLERLLLQLYVLVCLWLCYCPLSLWESSWAVCLCSFLLVLHFLCLHTY